MKREVDNVSERLGWHVIARGGDMTARVHGGMCLGQSAAEELSFEPAHAVVALAPEGGQLKLTVVRPDQELLVPGERPARAVLISPQTHVSLTFRSHTLDIDNDFALGRPARGTLHIEVIDTDSAASTAARETRGPVSAGRHRLEDSDVSNRTLVVSEASSALWTSPEDHLPRPGWHSLPPDLRRPLLLGSVLLAIVAVLLILAVYLPSRLLEPSATLTRPDSAAPESSPPETVVPETIVPETVIPETMTPTDVPEMETTAEAAMSEADGDARVSDALLDRFTDLISADRLPDRSTVDFMVESLRSLQTAYPNDPRVPEALNLLALRLLDEATRAYDGGDALQAGRLIELAVTTGAARSTVDDTLARMTARSPAVAPPERTVQSAAVTPEPAAAATVGEAADADTMPAADSLSAAGAPPAATRRGLSTRRGLFTRRRR